MSYDALWGSESTNSNSYSLTSDHEIGEKHFFESCLQNSIRLRASERQAAPVVVAAAVVVAIVVVAAAVAAAVAAVVVAIAAVVVAIGVVAVVVAIVVVAAVVAIVVVAAAAPTRHFLVWATKITICNTSWAASSSILAQTSFSSPIFLRNSCFLLNFK